MPPGKTSKLPSSMAFRVETFSFVFFEISSSEIPLVFRIDPTVHPSIGKVAIRLLPTGVLSAGQNSHYRSFVFIFVLSSRYFCSESSRPDPGAGIQYISGQTSTFDCFSYLRVTAKIPRSTISVIERIESTYAFCEPPARR